jgi:hypothetical protein
MDAVLTGRHARDVDNQASRPIAEFVQPGRLVQPHHHLGTRAIDPEGQGIALSVLVAQHDRGPIDVAIQQVQQRARVGQQPHAFVA